MLEKINDILWGKIMLVLLLGTGLWLSIRTGFFQIRAFGKIMRCTFLSLFKGKSATKSSDRDSISQFQAVSTALAATMGTGNIVGVATAITIGGAGAVFWMWVSSILGMALVYAENYLGTIYRKKRSGIWHGGPMAYLEHGTGHKALALCFATFCALASLGMGNMTQVNSISTAAFDSFGIPLWVSGTVVAVLAAAVITGGIKRIGSVTQLIIPFLSVAYIAAAVFIIVKNKASLPDAFADIFKAAFGITAVGGGISGAVISRTVSIGLRRGIFSNEAGLGSSALLHASADGSDPCRQGMWAIFEVFADTVVCCSVTALAILTSGASQSGKDGAPLVTEAFKSCFGNAAPVFITVSVLLFAFATIIGWFYCGECSVRYIFGDTGVDIYKMIFIVFIIIGSVSKLEAVWAVSDIFNGLMALPNLTGLILLRKQIKTE